MKNIILEATGNKLKGKSVRVVPVAAVESEAMDALRKSLSKPHARWADANGFEGAAGQVLLLPGDDGSLERVLFGLGSRSDEPTRDPFGPGQLSTALPKGVYAFEDGVPAPGLTTLAWALNAYSFDRYKKKKPADAQLVAPDGIDVETLGHVVEGACLARDLINTPAEDMGPEELEAAVRKLGRTHKAKVRTIKGKDLLEQNFPMIHTVGRASNRAPRLVDLTWGNARNPKITLVGKGVCFDTGGLNLKPGSSMALMKKDMGGAANVLGLASMIMATKLPVRLRVLIPAVDNNVSANSYRPSDVLHSRNGMTVEIGNTDAEGRLVLADALALADEEAPDLIVDMATLTGAARVALGPDLPPFYTDDEALAGDVGKHTSLQSDPVWRMPFWPRYDGWLDSKIADINHISEGGFAGSVTAALFLRRFVSKAGSYAHFDIFGWTPVARPGRPHGGADQAIRGLFSLLSARYPA